MWKGITDGLARHRGNLGKLFTSNAIGYAGNALSLWLIIAHAPIEVFAAYTIAQGVQTLAAGWFDAGLGSSIQVLVARGGTASAAAYRIASRRWTLAIIPAIAAVLIPGSLFLAHWQSHQNPQLHPELLLGFVGVGLMQARVLLAGSFAFGEGRFNLVCFLQSIAALSRLALILLLVWLRGRLVFSSLLGIEAGAAFLTWGAAALTGRRAHQLSVPVELPAARRELRKFLLPSMPSVFLGGIASTITLFGASLFAAPAAIAPYGVFQKFGQFFTFFWSPINQYVGRRLCVQGKTANRHDLARRYLVSALAGYGLFAAGALGLYLLAGHCWHHYSLVHPWAFAVWLVGTGGGVAYVGLDTVLAARGRADHRLASALLIALRTALVLLLRPSSLIAVVALDGLTLFPVIGYFYYRFTHPPATEEILPVAECANQGEAR